MADSIYPDSQEHSDFILLWLNLFTQTAGASVTLFSHKIADSIYPDGQGYSN